MLSWLSLYVFLLNYIYNGCLDSELSINISLNLSTLIHKTSSEFVSLTLPPKELEEISFDLSAVKLRTLCKELAPAYGRFGGTPADFIIFKPEVKYEQPKSNIILPTDQCYDLGCQKLPTKNYTMSGYDLDQLWQFTRDMGWQLLFDFNVLLRSGNQWDSSNVRLMLKYIVSHKYNRNMDFELGNEPNSFKHALNRTVAPDQLARDFQKLYEILKVDPEFKDYFLDNYLVGPDVTQPRNLKKTKYLEMFLENISPSVLNAITWHHYYVNAKSVSTSDFTDPLILDLYPERLSLIKTVLQKTGFGHKKIWMGETGSVSGGGYAGYTDAYVAGFMWLDKLGQGAQHGVDVVIRQSLFGSNYGLLDRETYEPLPDYWLTLLYKTLVGQGVLNVTNRDTSGKLRTYAHCTNPIRSHYSKGTIVLYMLNLFDNPVTIKLETALRTNVIDQYLLTPMNGDLKSMSVNLNSQLLKMIDDHTIPNLLNMKKTLPVGSNIVLPKLSFGFYVLTNFKSKLCF